MMFKLTLCVVMVSASTEGSQMDDRMVADVGMKVQDLHGTADSGAVNKQVYMAVRADGTIEKTNTKSAAGMTNSGTASSDSETNSGAANSGTENSDAVNWITQEHGALKKANSVESQGSTQQQQRVKSATLAASSMGGKADILCMGMAVIYTFFGITLLIAPDICWGPESYFCYWTDMDDSGKWFGRATGVLMTSLFCSPYYADMPTDKLMKVYLPINLVYTALFIYAAFFLTTTGPGKNAVIPFSLWYPLIPISGIFLILNVLALMDGPTEPTTA